MQHDTLRVLVLGSTRWSDAGEVATQLDRLPRDRAVKIFTMGRMGAELMAEKEAERRNWAVASAGPYIDLARPVHKRQTKRRKREDVRYIDALEHLLRSAKPQYVLLFMSVFSHNMSLALDAVTRYMKVPNSPCEHRWIVATAAASAQMSASGSSCPPAETPAAARPPPTEK